jgi:two-component system uhpT operon response regulator UhpA
MDDYLAPFDSVKAARKLREMGVTTPLLVMSMHDDADLIQASLDAGANGFIVKGGLLEELSPALWTVHQGGRYLCKQANAALAQVKR